MTKTTKKQKPIPIKGRVISSDAITVNLPSIIDVASTALISSVSVSAQPRIDAFKGLKKRKVRPLSEIIKRYWSGDGYLSHSAFEAFLQSPRHHIMYKQRKFKETKAKNFGSAAHSYILEEERFEKDYLVCEYGLPGSEAAKMYCDLIMAGANPADAFHLAGYKPRATVKATVSAIAKTRRDNEKFIKNLRILNGRTMISKKEFEIIEKMKTALWENISSRFVLEQITQTEIGHPWEAFDFKWYGFVDGKGDRIMCDLKTIADAVPRKLKRSLLYDDFDFTNTGPNVRQAAHYKIGGGFTGCDYYILGIDKDLHISVFKLSDRLLNVAWKDIKQLMYKFKSCLYNNQWNNSYDFWAKNGIYEV